jgi:RNA polymerase sigma factor (sigma-70 family)
MIAKKDSHSYPKINNLAIARLHEALAKLNEKQKQAVDLIFFQGLSHEKAAKVVGISQQAMTYRLQNAITNLKKDEALAGLLDMIKGREDNHD